MNLFLILKCTLISIVIGLFLWFYMHCTVRLLIYLIYNHVFLARLFSVVLIVIFCLVYSLVFDMFIYYLSCTLP